ncbi:MAG2810 family protein [Mycoplasmopsis lipofaciens]|uniref:MAG2810 family protein n=1 Tax=Mycoplasmopsis lipofaciens TaxID=114884 RepID=UPI000488EB2B|nr:hypothetical protein [Mycoplasmopsis lipofaciens]
MNKEKCIISKQMFEAQIKNLILKSIIKELDTFFNTKKTKKNLIWINILRWIFVTILLLGILSLIASLGTLIAFLFTEKLTFIEKNKSWFFATFFMLSFLGIIIGSFFTFIAWKKKKNFCEDVIDSFNSYATLKILFNYFNLKMHLNINDENLIVPNKNIISFFKNIKKFNDLDKNSIYIQDKYEQFEAYNAEQFFKFQNIEYLTKYWINKKTLTNKELRKMKKNNVQKYRNSYEKNLITKRFAVAAKINSLNRDISISLFDYDNLFTSSEFKKIEVAKAYEILNLKSKNPEYLEKWLEQKSNLEFLLELYKEINLTKINNPSISIKNLIKIKNKRLSIHIENQEAYIWFDCPHEIIELNFSSPSVIKEDIAEIIANKYINDFYTIYLLLELLTPFGLKLDIVNLQNKNLKNIEN